MRRVVRSLLLALALTAAPATVAVAHRDACHTWHACQPDANSAVYVCGDLGYFDYCQNPPNTHTTLVDFQPPQPRLTQPLPPPPPGPPVSNPTGAAPTPTSEPRPPLQQDCAKDRASNAVRNEIIEADNDPAMISGCLLPVTDPPLP
jgi:hypothetical protein